LVVVAGALVLSPMLSPDTPLTGEESGASLEGQLPETSHTVLDNQQPDTMIPDSPDTVPDAGIFDTPDTTPGTVIPGNPGTTPPVTVLSYKDVPIVKCQTMVSASATEIRDEDALASKDFYFDTAYLNHLFFRENVLLSFDIEAGETLTVISQNERGLNAMRYPEHYPADADQTTQMEWMKNYCYLFAWDSAYGRDTHTLTQADAFVMWNSPDKVAMGEDILTFVIRNTEGQITGAGSVLMVKYRPVEYTGNFFYDKASLVRWSVLGSVKFDDPAVVTEEAVQALLADMNQKAEEVKATFSFEPADSQENYIMALADMVNACYDIENAREMGYVDFFAADGCSYFKLSIFNQRHDHLREFLLYADGTWQELMPDSFWVLTDHLMGANAFFMANFTDGTSRHMDEERAVYEAEDAHYYGYHYFANNIVWLEQAETEFEVAMDRIINFLFNTKGLSGKFSYRVTPQVENHDFREVFFTIGDVEYQFMVFSNGSWGLIYQDSGYEDEATLTGRKIVFTNGRVFVLEWQDVYKAGVEEPIHLLAPTYLNEVVVIPAEP